jgi:hypothetical protein
MEVLVIEHEKLLAQKLKELLFEVDESIRIVGITNDLSPISSSQTRKRWLTSRKSGRRTSGPW